MCCKFCSFDPHTHTQLSFLRFVPLLLYMYSEVVPEVVNDWTGTEYMSWCARKRCAFGKATHDLLVMQVAPMGSGCSATNSILKYPCSN